MYVLNFFFFFFWNQSDLVLTPMTPVILSFSNWLRVSLALLSRRTTLGWSMLTMWKGLWQTAWWRTTGGSLYYSSGTKGYGQSTSTCIYIYLSMCMMKFTPISVKFCNTCKFISSFLSQIGYEINAYIIVIIALELWANFVSFCFPLLISTQAWRTSAFPSTLRVSVRVCGRGWGSTSLMLTTISHCSTLETSTAQGKKNRTNSS